MLLLERHDLPSVTVAARVSTGARDDTDGTSGTANLVGRMLEEGTRSFTHRQISEKLEFVGAQFGVGVGRTTTTVSLGCLSAHFPSLAPLYAEMLTSPTFPSDRLNLERSRTLSDLQEADEDPADVASRLFYASVFKGHPHHRPIAGHPDTVRRIGPEQLRQFHARYFEPGSTTIAVVGDFRTEDVLNEFTRLLSGWAPRQAARDNPPPPGQTQAETLRRSMDKAQTQVVLGHLGVSRLDPDYVPLLVMDSILGEGVAGGFTARIPFQLRDVQGLAYGVGSSITASAALDPGVFVAQMGTAPANETKAIAALLAEVRKIRDAPVSEQERIEAVNYLVNSYVFEFETNAQLADYLLTCNQYRLGFDYRQRFPDEVRRVTRSDVQRVAREHLRPDAAVLVVVGPPEKG